MWCATNPLFDFHLSPVADLPAAFSSVHLRPTGSGERGVLGVGSIPVAILPSCQDM